MKSNIWILLLCFWFVGCNDFLEESSQDEVRPSTVEDLNQLLLGEAYMDWYPAQFFFSTTDNLTDDIQCNGISESASPGDELYVERGRWLYQWDKNMFTKDGSDQTAYTWELLYQKIKGCNVIVDYMARVTGDEKEMKSVMGEALVARGYYYLVLVNLFGQPYNVGDPEKNLGVPLKLTMDVTPELLTRNTVAQVYRSIEKDLMEGNRLLEESGIQRSYQRMGHLAAKALLSRMYLYMENWDKVLEYADQVLSVMPGLLGLSGLEKDGLRWTDAGVYNDDKPTEIIWARMTRKSSGYGLAPYSPSKALIDSYTFNYDEDNDDYQGDLRPLFFFNWNKNPDTDELYVEMVLKDKDEGNEGIRNAEIYLNRAEAYVRKYMAEGKEEFRMKALEDLNYLRKNRYENYSEEDIRDAQELFDFCKEERRRELCGENHHRWFDLRRYGMPPIKHVYFVHPGEEQVYMLEQGSPRYVLPIPQVALEANSKLVQNP